MNRRDSLKVFALVSAAGAWPTLALAQGEGRVAIYDGRFPEGRAFGQLAARAYDCQGDAASLWFSRFSGQAGSMRTIAGLTCAADAMILADCARREGLAFSHTASTPAGDLFAWTITPKAFG